MDLKIPLKAEMTEKTGRAPFSRHREIQTQAMAGFQTGMENI